MKHGWWSIRTPSKFQGKALSQAEIEELENCVFPEQKLRHISRIDIEIYIYQKPKSLVMWEGRPDFSFLFKSCEIDRSQGRLVK